MDLAADCPIFRIITMTTPLREVLTFRFQKGVVPKALRGFQQFDNFANFF